MEWILWWSAGCAGISCLAHARGRFQARQRLGRVLHVERGSKRARVLYVGVGCVALFLVLLSGLGVLATGAWAIPGYATAYLIAGVLVVLSVAAVVLATHPEDGACGTEGVRSGSWSHAYGDLEEWRLTGDHLRFRFGGVWRAVALPQALHGEVRGLLETKAKGLESRFKR